MLSWLSIRNLALADSVELELDPGLNVLTGETGAGKSLVAGSIGLLVGERADAGWLRAGERRGSVEAIVDLAARVDLLDALQAAQIECEDGRLTLRREIHEDGKGRAFVNGRAVPVGQLRAVGELLVDLHGQHEHQLLLRPERQADFFDAWAGLGGERRALEAERETLLERRRALREARSRWERDRDSEAALREDHEELRAAALVADEEDRLAGERDRLRHRERLLRGYAEAQAAVSGEETGATDALARAARTLRTVAPLDPSAESLEREVEQIQARVGELESALERESSRLAEEPLDLEAIEGRLDLLHRLKRKHRTDLVGLIALRDALETKARSFDPSGRDLETEERAHDERGQAFERRLDAFLTHRRDRFTAFERAVAERLANLGLREAALRIAPSAADSARAAVDPSAIPGLEFAFEPNPGEGERPLRRIASGGELSRIMLAIKSLMAERDQVAVLVFDEVDQGIGGAVAEEVGRLLRALGARRQVLCITHLPLIAAYGARHFVVRKSTRAGRTTLSARALPPKERETEVARLLAGDRATETTRRQARELLASAAAGSEPPARVQRLATRGA